MFCFFYIKFRYLRYIVVLVGDWRPPSAVVGYCILNFNISLLRGGGPCTTSRFYPHLKFKYPKGAAILHTQQKHVN